MTIKKYIHSLSIKMRSGDNTEATKLEYAYAKAYENGDTAISELRSRLIEAEIAKRYSKGQELRITINYIKNPTDAVCSQEFFDHENYVAECKFSVDNRLASCNSILISNISY